MTNEVVREAQQILGHFGHTQEAAGCEEEGGSHEGKHGRLIGTSILENGWGELTEPILDKETEKQTVTCG